MFARKAFSRFGLVAALACASGAVAQVGPGQRDLDELGVADIVSIHADFLGVSVKSAESGASLVSWTNQEPEDWFGWRFAWLGTGADTGMPVAVVTAPMAKSAGGDYIGKVYGLAGDGSVAWSVTGTATSRTGLSLAVIPDIDCDGFSDVLSSWWDPTSQEAGFDLISGAEGRLLRRDLGAMQDVVKSLANGKVIYVCGDLTQNLSATSDDLLAFFAASETGDLETADVNSDGAITAQDLNIVVDDVSNNAQAETFGAGGQGSAAAMAIGDCFTVSFDCSAWTSSTTNGLWGAGWCQICSVYSRTCKKFTICDTGLECCPAVIPWAWSETTGAVCVTYPGNGTATPCSNPPPAPVPIIPPGYVPNPAKPGELMPAPPPAVIPAPKPRLVPNIPGPVQWPNDEVIASE